MVVSKRAGQCDTFIPYSGDGTGMSFIHAWNYSDNAYDGLADQGYAPGWANQTTINGTGIDSYGGKTFAVFKLSEVPLPAAAWLFGSALLGLVATKRKSA
jgi:hypothetical protein